VWQAETELEPVPASVPAARRFVSEALIAAGADDDVWAVAQLTSELATNAVVHAATPFVVKVAVGERTIRISVADRRPKVAAARRNFGGDATTGRGLRMVDSLSEAWGTDVDGTTKTVWCEVARALQVGIPDGVTADDEPASTVGDGEPAGPARHAHGAEARASDPTRRRRLDGDAA
jgi:hypothetical protein